MASSNGAAVFSTNCSTCHSSGGKGGIAPPLAGNALVIGDPQKVIHIVKDGLTGAVQVNGKNYNGTMPAWKGILSNADLAGVITYIRSSWGNKASAVTSAQVSSTP
jgi:mono/diheme cytochrome c family protein